jgi:hypothetical protein
MLGENHKDVSRYYSVQHYVILILFSSWNTHITSINLFQNDNLGWNEDSILILVPTHFCLEEKYLAVCVLSYDRKFMAD